MRDAFEEEVEVFRSRGRWQIDMISARFLTHAFPRHYHDTYLIEVVTEGVDEFLCGSRKLRAEPGTVIFIHPGEVHTGKSATGEVLEYRAIYPSVELMSFLGCGRPPSFSQNVVRDPALAAEIADAHRFAQQMPGEHAEDRVAAVLAKAISRHADSALDGKGEAKAVRQVRELIESDPSRNFTLDELAWHAGFSPFHFARLFAKARGLPPHEYLLAYRAELARKLLRSGCSAAEASAKLGFSDQAHFTRSFRRIAGTTPGAFRYRLD
jgi:AraC-like DNA-binding protein